MRVSSVFSTAEGTRHQAFGLAEWALLTGIAAVWGSSFLLIAIGVDSFRPGVVAALRLLFGAGFLAFLPGAWNRIHTADTVRIIVLAVVWVAFPLLAFPYAEQWIASSLAGMINGAMPIFASLIAAMLLRRRPRGVHLAGIGLGFVGVVAIGWPTIHGSPATLQGAVLVLLATIAYGVSVNLAVPLQHRYGALPVLLRIQLVGLLLVLPFGVAQVSSSTFSWSSLLATVALGVLGTGLAFVAMTELAGRVGATRASVAIYFLPVVAIILGVALRGEIVAPISVVGTVIVLVGAFLTSRAEQPPTLR